MEQTNYTLKEKEEIFAICRLIERVSLLVLIKISFLVSMVRKRKTLVFLPRQDGSPKKCRDILW